LGLVGNAKAPQDPPFGAADGIPNPQPQHEVLPRAQGFFHHQGEGLVESPGHVILRRQGGLVALLGLFTGRGVPGACARLKLHQGIAQGARRGLGRRLRWRLVLALGLVPRQFHLAVEAHPEDIEDLPILFQQPLHGKIDLRLLTDRGNPVVASHRGGQGEASEQPLAVLFRKLDLELVDLQLAGQIRQLGGGGLPRPRLQVGGGRQEGEHVAILGSFVFKTEEAGNPGDLVHEASVGTDLVVEAATDDELP